jgi:hypothetical protein
MSYKFTNFSTQLSQVTLHKTLPRQPAQSPDLLGNKQKHRWPRRTSRLRRRARVMNVTYYTYAIANRSYDMPTSRNKNTTVPLVMQRSKIRITR